MRDKEEGGLAERTHLPAIIFALRIIIASCVDGTSLTPSTRPRTKKTLDPRPLERRLRHGLGRRRLDDLGLARFQGVEARSVRLEQVLELDALVLREHVFGHLVLVGVLLLLLRALLGLLGLRRDLRLRLGDGGGVLVVVAGGRVHDLADGGFVAVASSSGAGSASSVVLMPATVFS